jgi:hypothetical protein
MKSNIIAIFAHSGVSNRFFHADSSHPAMQTTINCVKEGFKALLNGSNS